MFQGFVQLEGSIPLSVLVTDSSRSPANADASPAPSYRVYGPGGLMPNGAGALAPRDGGAVEGATAAAPVVVASPGHGLATGARVTVSGGLGLAGLNGTRTVTVVDADHFALDGTSGVGTYLGSGVWNVTGLYGLTLAASSADGYDAGETYTVLASWAVAGVAGADAVAFGVV